MTIKASEIPSVVEMSTANIKTKRDLRRVIRDCMPKLIKALDGLGDCPIVSSDNPNLTGRLQHVDLAIYYEPVARANALLCEAYCILADLHNEQTAHGEDIGIIMDAPNGDGGGR